MRNGALTSFREEVKNSRGLRRPRVSDTLILVVSQKLACPVLADFHYCRYTV